MERRSRRNHRRRQPRAPCVRVRPLGLISRPQTILPKIDITEVNVAQIASRKTQPPEITCCLHRYGEPLRASLLASASFRSPELFRQPTITVVVQPLQLPRRDKVRRVAFGSLITGHRLVQTPIRSPGESALRRVLGNGRRLERRHESMSKIGHIHSAR